MADFREVLVHYLTQNGAYGERAEAEQAIEDLLKAASDRAIDRLCEDGLIRA